MGGPASSANATDAQYTVSYEGGSSNVTVNQRVNGGQWVLLGTYPFNAAGTGYKVDLADSSASGKVVADAIYYVRDSAPVDSFTWTPDIQAAGDYQLYAHWTASSANSGAAQYTVVHDGGTSLVTVSQKQNGGQWNLLGTWNFAPSAGHQVTLTAASDGNVVADAIKLVGTGPAPADLVYLHSDQIGLPKKITDAMQAVVWDRIQDPFGRQVSLTNSGGIDTALRFPGQQADPDTGFAYNYFRDYDPTLGRYVQADPIGLKGGINRYAYVAGNPITYTDPFGLDTQLSIGVGGTLAAFIGVGGSVSFGINIPTDPSDIGGYQVFGQLQGNWLVGGGIYLGLGGQVGLSDSCGPLNPGISTSDGWYAEADARYGPSVGASIQGPGKLGPDMGLPNGVGAGVGKLGFGAGVYLGYGGFGSVTLASPTARSLYSAAEAAFRAQNPAR